MTVVLVLCAFVFAVPAALCIGYQLGRRTGPRPSTWHRRTSRTALGGAAMNLVALLIARQVRRRVLRI